MGSDTIDKLVQIKIAADTGRAVSALSGLRDSLGETGKEAGGFGEKFEKALSSLAGPLAQVREGYEALHKAFELAGEAANDERLRARVSDLYEIHKATAGLVSDHELLVDRVKSLNGAFALSTSQFEEVSQFAVMLHDQGLGPVNEILDRLTDGLRTGHTRALAEYGINLDETHGKANQVAEAFSQMEEKLKGFHHEGDAAEETETKFNNWLDETKVRLGHFIGDMISAADAVAKWADKLGLGSDKLNLLAGSLENYEKIRGMFVKAQNYDDNSAAADTVGPQASIPKEAPVRPGFVPQPTVSGPIVVYVSPELANPMQTGNNAYFYGANGPQGAIGAGTEAPLSAPGFSPGLNLSSIGLGAIGGATQGGGNEAQRQDNTAATMKMVQDQTTALGAAFSSLTSGVSAAVDAAITGGESIGKAFAKAAASTLKSIAIKDAVLGLEEGAHALASLAAGDGVSAAAHGIAAAKYEAAAIAAGIGAAALGAASGGSGGGGGGGAARPAGNGYVGVGGSSGSSSGTTNITVNVSGVAASSKAELGKTIIDAIDAANAAGKGRRSMVVYG